MVSCLVRDAARKPCASSPSHLWLDDGHNESFIIESVEGVLFFVRQCIVVLVWSGSLLRLCHGACGVVAFLALSRGACGVVAFLTLCVWSCRLRGVVSAD
jgi:hypothetical protein